MLAIKNFALIWSVKFSGTFWLPQCFIVQFINTTEVQGFFFAAQNYQANIVGRLIKKVVFLIRINFSIKDSYDFARFIKPSKMSQKAGRKTEQKLEGEKPNWKRVEPRITSACWELIINSAYVGASYENSMLAWWHSLFCVKSVGEQRLTKKELAKWHKRKLEPCRHALSLVCVCVCGYGCVCGTCWQLGGNEISRISFGKKKKTRKKCCRLFNTLAGSYIHRWVL